MFDIRQSVPARTGADYKASGFVRLCNVITLHAGAVHELAATATD